SNLCINKTNRLKSKFWNDLPQIKKNLKTKCNVKNDDSCSSLIVSLKLLNIKCKLKDDKTKCVVKNDHCSSSLIVSIKLSSIKLETSNPKKDVIFTYEEPPNTDIVRRRQRDYVYYPGNEEFQRWWCEILNLKFVTAARILPGSPQHHCQMKEFLIVLLMSLVIGTVYFMPFHISLLGHFFSNTNYVK
uniref:Uncharacterized protein n=1 Tax=Amphimedon queenslandica TaxID=400682 RepID=A0A1X7UZ23_AMPQE